MSTETVVLTREGREARVSVEVGRRGGSVLAIRDVQSRETYAALPLVHVTDERLDLILDQTFDPGTVATIAQFVRETEDRQRQARKALVDLIHKVGTSFHPDTKGEDYADLPPGLAPAVDWVVREAFACGLDVYGITLDTLHDML